MIYRRGQARKEIFKYIELNSGLIVKTRKHKFLMNLIRYLFHSSYATLA
jgi:hypothetical protein